MNNDMQTMNEIWIAGYRVLDLAEVDPIFV